MSTLQLSIGGSSFTLDPQVDIAALTEQIVNALQSGGAAVPLVLRDSVEGEAHLAFISPGVPVFLRSHVDASDSLPRAGSARAESLVAHEWFDEL